METTDHELLTQYGRQGRQDAFAELVKRHLNLVYSVARRQVGSPELAAEVSQMVFIHLSREASRLPVGTVLPAWLFTVARRKAIDAVRAEARRRAREGTAASLAEADVGPSPWSAVEPLLDDAMNELDAGERAAVLLRYFGNRSLRDVGRELGISDDAAQKRVGRALDRLRDLLRQRGLAATSAVLASQLASHAVENAPSSVATSVWAGATSVSSITAAPAIVGGVVPEIKFLAAAAVVATGVTVFMATAPSRFSAVAATKPPEVAMAAPLTPDTAPNPVPSTISTRGQRPTRVLPEPQKFASATIVPLREIPSATPPPAPSTSARRGSSLAKPGLRGVVPFATAGGMLDRMSFQDMPAAAVGRLLRDLTQREVLVDASMAAITTSAEWGPLTRQQAVEFVVEALNRSGLEIEETAGDALRLRRIQ